MKKYIYLLSVVIFIGCKKVNNDCNLNEYPNAAEKDWFFEHNGSEEEAHGHFILACSDGGYLQIGETGFIPNSAKILVVKTNSSGNLLWKKEFSSGGHNLGNSAIEIADGYLICGSMNENSALIKLNKTDGSVIFEQTYNNGGSDAFEHIAESSSGFIAVGYVNAEDSQNTFYTQGEGFVSFLDNNGFLVNGININTQLSHAYRIKNYNNEYFISGLTEEASQYGLIKIDSIGNLIWSKDYGGSNFDHCFGMDLSDNGFIFLTGHTLSGTENWDTYTIKINQNGEKVWETIAGNPRGFDPKYIHDEAWGIHSTNDGGCIVVAGTGDEYGNYKRRCGRNGDDSNTWHVFLIKFDANGNLDWQMTYGNDEGGDWAGEDIDITLDGGAIVAVDNGSFGFLKLKPF
jgi:hypothetical protein